MKLRVLAMVLLSTNPTLAAGIALREGSADWMANAFAGQTAKAYDASTIFSNPAGMTRLQWNEIDVSLNVVAPSTSFSGTNTIGGLPTIGSQGGNPLEPLAVPSGFGVWNSSPDLKFGMAVTAPFGARLAYPQDFVGRYQSVVSSLTDIQVSLAAAYRINRHLSIGGGPVINFLSTRLTQAINLGRLSSRFGDPIGDFSGSSAGVSFALGALYEFDDTFRVGLTYRSRFQPTIDGMQSVTVSPSLRAASPPTAAVLAASSGPASTQISLPDSFSIGVYKQIDERWAVMADLQWTNWSLVDTVMITSLHAPPVVLAEHWRDTWFGAIGANFRPSKKLLLQAGIGYDLSPVTNDNRTTRVPDANRLVIGGGVTYGVMENIDVQLAIAEIISSAAKINSSISPAAGTIDGSYHTNITTFSLGMAVRF